MSKESAQIGLPGDRENTVKLMANHGDVCKFGASQRCRDNMKLVGRNVSDVYKKTLKKRESAVLSILAQAEDVEMDFGDGEGADHVLQH